MGYPGYGGMGVLYLTYIMDQLVVGLGLELKGRYRNQYSLCAGSMEPKDQGCYLELVKRELWEEFKIKLKFADFSFDQVFKNQAGRIRYFFHHGTPIFIGYFGQNQAMGIQNRMEADLLNYALPPSFHEMSDFQYFDYPTLGSMLGLPLPISSFARGVVRGSAAHISF